LQTWSEIQNEIEQLLFEKTVGNITDEEWSEMKEKLQRIAENCHVELKRPLTQ